MTYYCAECVVNWWPFMCTDGACPVCGRGTKRVQEPASPEAPALHKAALVERIARERSEHNHRLFDEYLANRDALRGAAQPTESIDTLEVTAELPTFDPEQHGEEDVAA